MSQVFNFGPGGGARWGQALGSGLSNVLSGLAHAKTKQLESRSLENALKSQNIPNASSLATLLQSQPKAGLELLKQHIQQPENESYAAFAQQFLDRLGGTSATQGEQQQPLAQSQPAMQGQANANQQQQPIAPIKTILPQQVLPSNKQQVAPQQESQQPIIAKPQATPPLKSLNRNQLRDVVQWARDASNFESAQQQKQFNQQLALDAQKDRRLLAELSREDKKEIAQEKLEEKKTVQEQKVQEHIDKKFQKFNENLKASSEIANDVIDELYLMRDTRLKGNVAAGNFGLAPMAFQNADSQLYNTIGDKIASRLTQGQRGLPTAARMKWEKGFKPSLNQSPDVQQKLEDNLFKEAFTKQLTSDIRDKIVDENGGNQPKNLDILVNRKISEAKKELPEAYDYTEGDQAILDNGDAYILSNRRWKPVQIRI